MPKYDKRSKLSIVRQHIPGKRGKQAIAFANDLTYSMVGRRIAAYRAHDVAGLERKSASYDLRFKRMVLKRMRRDELSYSQTSARFNMRIANDLTTDCQRI